MKHGNSGSKQAFKNVARVVGKIGKEGEVKVEPIDNLPFLLHEGMMVHLTPPKLTGLRSANVLSIREVGDAYGVRFEGCNTVSQAFELENRLCLVSVEDLEGYEEEEDPMNLVGMGAVDERLGQLGTINDVRVNPLQILLVIGEEEQPDKYMIPLVDEFVTEFDEDTIFTHIPDDLANLNC